MLWCGGNLPILIQRVKIALINVKKNVDPSKRKSKSLDSVQEKTDPAKIDSELIKISENISIKNLISQG